VNRVRGITRNDDLPPEKYVVLLSVAGKYCRWISITVLVLSSGKRNVAVAPFLGTTSIATKCDGTVPSV